MKTERAERIRKAIIRDIDCAEETMRSDADLTAVSFAGRPNPNRAIWISTHVDGRECVVIDFEDLQQSGRVDYTAFRVRLGGNESELIDLCKSWLEGQPKEKCVELLTAASTLMEVA